MNTKNLVFASMMTALAVILSVIGLFVPVLFFTAFLIPVPIIIATVKSGRMYGFLSTIVIFLINLIISDIITALILAGFCLIGLIIGYFIDKNHCGEDTVKETSIISLFILIFALYVLKAFKINVIENILDLFSKTNSEVISFYSKTANLASVKDIFSTIEEMMRISVPSAIIIFIIILVLVNYIFASKILKMQGINVSELPHFQEWRMPYITGWVFIGALLYNYFWTYDIISSNIIILLATGFTISGLAFVKYYLTNKLNIKAAVSTVILILLLLIPIGSYLLILIGIVDTGMNLRRFS
ncbi:DUF2232 domain-containing protein [Aceticella autotrophica]|uniref:DUF2232 domain-containing protein n=1 Tax=Aceticella autotrophica TaxID=2755338 RepID=A0A975AVR4_9THEO|nr:DUF2232 domain-containing protein [Aceticella autotrophica]QSZ27347.1 DUF2232 domain-containing protein [Aceticella autotrophica]